MVERILSGEYETYRYGPDAWQCQFALVKEPMTNVRKYISGVEIHKDYYQFVVRLDTQTDKSCIENGSWMEQLTDWIEDRNRNRNFPDIQGGTVKTVGVSSPFFMGENGQNEALYQMTIFIEYKKGTQVK